MSITGKNYDTYDYTFLWHNHNEAYTYLLKPTTIVFHFTWYYSKKVFYWNSKCTVEATSAMSSWPMYPAVSESLEHVAHSHKKGAER